MAGSYEKINYALRPAKSIERKMMAEALRRLSGFGSLETYRYVGFGSTYFSDFRLFHRLLGIRNMISIEKDVDNEDRFEFNRPYRCIEMQYDTSTNVLPQLSKGVRTILWLDYDCRINREVLADIEFFCGDAQPGSMLMITVNVNPGKKHRRRLKNLVKRVGKDNVPSHVRLKDLPKWGTARVNRIIIDNKIKETLQGRNGLLPTGSQILYKQIFNFHYQDSSRMLTVGGVLYDEGQDGILAQCNFDSLPFVRTDENPYLIEVPPLTLKEVRHLNAQLPIDDPADLEASRIPEEHLNQYSRVYRHFPSFVEAEL